MFYQKKYVDPLSLDSAVGDLEPRDDNTYVEDVYIDQIFDLLTDEERDIAEKLIEGENFHQIAKQKNYNTNQIYKIKHNLAEKLEHLHETSSYTDVKNVVMLYLLSRLNDLPKRIWTRWEYDSCLKEYKRPSIKTITESLEELIIGMAGGRVIDRTIKKRKRDNTIPIHQLPLFQ